MDRQKATGQQRRLVQAFLVGIMAILGMGSGMHAQPALAEGTAAATVQATSQGGQTIVITDQVWPRAFGFDGENVWVANGFDNTVIRFTEGDPPKPVGSAIPVGQMPSAMAWDSLTNTMWVAGYDDFSLTIIDKAGKVAGTLSPASGSPLNGHPIALKYAGTFMWVVTQDKDGVTQFDTGKQKPINQIGVGKFPTAIESDGAKRLFVANGNEDTISVIDITSGKVAATYTDSIPPFPISLAFDGQYLWVGNYDATDDKKAKIAKISPADGKAVDLTAQADLQGRSVAVYYANGHLWVANAHAESATDVDSQHNVKFGIEARQVMVKKEKNDGYSGAVLVTAKYVYMADWLNDRVIRIPAPKESIPTNTPAPPTATPTITPTATVTPPCNPDPKFPPRLKVGDTARVINDKFAIEVRVRKAPNFSKDAQSGKSFKPDGTTFTILEGPVGNDKDDKDKTCFYRVEGSVDKSITGWVTEGGLESDAPNKRYYIEAVPK